MTHDCIVAGIDATDCLEFVVIFYHTNSKGIFGLLQSHKQEALICLKRIFLVSWLVISLSMIVWNCSWGSSPLPDALIESIALSFGAIIKQTSTAHVNGQTIIVNQ
jgi:hypothetical protein